MLAPPGPPMQGPPQQSEAELQASPATRQKGNSWQVAAPPSLPVGDAELAAAVGVGGAGLSGGTTARAGGGAGAGHAGGGAAVAVGARSCRRPARRPARRRRRSRSRASSNRSGATQGCSSEAQPTGSRQTRSPATAGSIPQGTSNSRRPGDRADPSPWQRASGVQVPAGQRPEQQSAASPQALPLAAQAAIGRGRGVVSSTSRRQPSADSGERRSQQRGHRARGRRPQGCAPGPASRRAVATRRPLGNLSR